MQMTICEQRYLMSQTVIPINAAIAQLFNDPVMPLGGVISELKTNYDINSAEDIDYDIILLWLETLQMIIGPFILRQLL